MFISSTHQQLYVHEEENIDMKEIEEIVYHKDQMVFDFNWEEIDDDLIQREATLAVECELR